MLKTCVILNGPPNSGKDTIARKLVEFGFHHEQMKNQLYVDTAAYFGVDLAEFTRRATDRELKEAPWEELATDDVDGTWFRSPRNALIHVSETVIKPEFGKEYFGEKAAKRCLRGNHNQVVFSDGGFYEEVAPLMRCYDTTYIIRLHRQGCNFDNDSRTYLLGFRHTYDMVIVDDFPEITVAAILNLVNEQNRKSTLADCLSVGGRKTGGGHYVSNA